MKKNVREYLQVTHQESDQIAQLNIPPNAPQAVISFFVEFNIRGIRLDRFQPGFFSCSFPVPPRLTDRNGNLAAGAIASLVDTIGATLVYEKEVPLYVSVKMSISYLSTAKLNDALEISGTLLGGKGGGYRGKGGFRGTLVILKNKATGEMIAEGRHSLFSKPASKL